MKLIETQNVLLNSGNITLNFIKLSINKKCIIMRKMFLISAKFLLAILFCLPLLISCGKDVSSNPNNPDNPNNPLPDPEGTITSNISTSTFIGLNGWSLGWISPDNFHFASGWSTGTGYPNYYFVRISVCNLGTKKGLGNIQSIPTNGYSAPTVSSKSIACEVGHGYVFKVEILDNNEPTGEIFHVRLYVEKSLISTSGGIMGAKVKYQYPFEP